MELAYTTLDVFTKTPYEGNPLAVVTIPPGTVLTQSQKQSIAREFNFSETVFVHDVPDPSGHPQRTFDIFTPTMELPFAGHPTIGTATLLHPLGVTVLQAKAGLIRIEPAATPGALRAAIPHSVRLHGNRMPALPSIPSLTASELPIAAAEAGAPIFSIVNGMAFALIELPTLEALATTRPGLLPALPDTLLDDGWRANWDSWRYYFTRTGTRQEAGRTVHAIRTRMIDINIEDPATGSAACALCCYLSLHVLEGEKLGFEVTQGVEMGRRSDILVDVEVERDDEGKRSIKSLFLGGTAVQVMSGTLRAPKAA